MLADALVAQGIDTVFVVPGESYLDVLDGLYAVGNQVKLVTCRFEAGAVNMAEAYGKLTGRPAAAMVTRGPGACHGAIGVHVAQQDSTPMLLFVGQIPFEETDRESFQEVDYRRMFGPLAKWVTQIDDARRIPELVAHAVDVATTGRPGPVVIALSEEMQKHRVDVPDLPRAPVFPPLPDPAALERMQAMLAEQPQAAGDPGRLRLDGGGAAPRSATSWSRTTSRSRSASGGRRSMTARCPTSSATSASAPTRRWSRAPRRPTSILAIGTRLGEAVTQGYTLFDQAGAHADRPRLSRAGRDRPRVPPGARHRRRPERLRQRRGRAEAGPGAVGASGPQSLRALREAGREVPDYEGRSTSAGSCASWRSCAAPDAIFTCDAGNFADLAGALHQLRRGPALHRPDQRRDGLRRARRDRRGDRLSRAARSIVFVGDGGMLMTGQEIATAFHHGVAPILLVFNNAMYGTIRMYQERTYPGRVSGHGADQPGFRPASSRASAAMARWCRRRRSSRPPSAARRQSGKPALIELRMNPEQITSRATIAQLRAGTGVVKAAR